MKYHKLIENAGKPRGFWGNLMINSMNKGHIEVTDWGLKHIKINKTDTVLDVGCGGGKTVTKIADMIANGKVYGVDYSVLCVDRSEKLNHKNILCNKVKILLAPAEKLPFEADTFDKVVAIETFYFWKNKAKGLQEIYRVLNENGRILLVFEMLKTKENPNKWKKIEDKLGISAVTEEEIADFLTSAGFSDVRTYTKTGTTWLCATATKITKQTGEKD